MQPGPDAIPKDCYQCGWPAQPFTLDEKATESGWFSCDNCGERLISISDTAAIIQGYEERAIRDKLGVEQFLSTRGINNRVDKE